MPLPAFACVHLQVGLKLILLVVAYFWTPLLVVAAAAARQVVPMWASRLDAAEAKLRHWFGLVYSLNKSAYIFACIAGLLPQVWTRMGGKFLTLNPRLWSLARTTAPHILACISGLLLSLHPFPIDSLTSCHHPHLT